jgi:hypothetical protein
MSLRATVMAFALGAALASCSGPTSISDAAEGGIDAVDSIDAISTPDTPPACMCNCDVGPTRIIRGEDLPSCGIPGSGPTYAMCCGI